MMSLFLFLVGLFALVFGADRLVDGASQVSKRAGVSDFLVGATVVAVGTSLPELVVSFVGVLQGSPDIAVGNVVGSNIMNVLLVLGLTAVVSPVFFPYRVWKSGIGLCFALTSMTAFCFYEYDTLSRVGAIVLLLFYALYIYRETTVKPRDPESDLREMVGPKTFQPIWKIIFNIFVGVVGLSAGGHLFVNGAVEIFSAFGMSEKFIAVTVLAGGTSAPELITCLIASYKKKDEIVMGNIIGSNIANLSLVLGVCGVVKPQNITLSGVDILFLFSSVLFLFIATIPKRESGNGVVTRYFGLMLIFMYLEYIFLSVYS